MNKNKKAVSESILQKYEYRKPKWIWFGYFDPFDDARLGETTFPYNARMSADGFYTGGVKIMREGLKKIKSKLLEGRTPSVKVKLIH